MPYSYSTSSAAGIESSITAAFNPPLDAATASAGNGWPLPMQDPYRVAVVDPSFSDSGPTDPGSSRQTAQRWQGLSSSKGRSPNSFFSPRIPVDVPSQPVAPFTTSPPAPTRTGHSRGSKSSLGGDADRMDIVLDVREALRSANQSDSDIFDTARFPIASMPTGERYTQLLEAKLSAGSHAMAASPATRQNNHGENPVWLSAAAPQSSPQAVSPAIDGSYSSATQSHGISHTYYSHSTIPLATAGTTGSAAANFIHSPSPTTLMGSRSMPSLTGGDQRSSSSSVTDSPRPNNMMAVAYSPLPSFYPHANQHHGPGDAVGGMGMGQTSSTVDETIPNIFADSSHSGPSSVIAAALPWGYDIQHPNPQGHHFYADPAVTAAYSSSPALLQHYPHRPLPLPLHEATPAYSPPTFLHPATYPRPPRTVPPTIGIESPHTLYSTFPQHHPSYQPHNHVGSAPPRGMSGEPNSAPVLWHHATFPPPSGSTQSIPHHVHDRSLSTSASASASVSASTSALASASTSTSASVSVPSQHSSSSPDIPEMRTQRRKPLTHPARGPYADPNKGATKGKRMSFSMPYAATTHSSSTSDLNDYPVFPHRDGRGAPIMGPGPDLGVGAHRQAEEEERKVVIACYNCRAKKLRCNGARPRCHHCARRGEEQCSYDATLRRRGPGKKNKDKVGVAAGVQQEQQQQPKKARSNDDAEMDEDSSDHASAEMEYARGRDDVSRRAGRRSKDRDRDRDKGQAERLPFSYANSELGGDPRHGFHPPQMDFGS